MCEGGIVNGDVSLMWQLTLVGKVNYYDALQKNGKLLVIGHKMSIYISELRGKLYSPDLLLYIKYKK